MKRFVCFEHSAFWKPFYILKTLYVLKNLFTFWKYFLHFENAFVYILKRTLFAFWKGFLFMFWKYTSSVLKILSFYILKRFFCSEQSTFWKTLRFKNPLYVLKNLFACSEYFLFAFWKCFVYILKTTVYILKVLSFHVLKIYLLFLFRKYFPFTFWKGFSVLNILSTFWKPFYVLKALFTFWKTFLHVQNSSFLPFENTLRFWKYFPRFENTLPFYVLKRLSLHVQKILRFTFLKTLSCHVLKIYCCLQKIDCAYLLFGLLFLPCPHSNVFLFRSCFSPCQVACYWSLNEKGKPEDFDSFGELGHPRESNCASCYFGRSCKCPLK